MDLTGDGGVIKTVLTSAKADAPQPNASSPIADVHYEGRLESTGEVFDSSRVDGAVFSFEVGKGSVIRGWDVGVKTMKVGEIAELKCRADYAYGAAGAPPEIPPNATLVFEVELMAVRAPKGKDDSAHQRLAEARQQREEAARKREEEKEAREKAKAEAAARVQAKMDAKKGGGKAGKGKK